MHLDDKFLGVMFIALEVVAYKRSHVLSIALWYVTCEFHEVPIQLENLVTQHELVQCESVDRKTSSHTFVCPNNVMFYPKGLCTNYVCFM